MGQNIHWSKVPDPDKDGINLLFAVCNYFCEMALNPDLMPADQQYYFMYPTKLSMADFEQFVEFESTQRRSLHEFRDDVQR